MTFERLEARLEETPFLLVNVASGKAQLANSDEMLAVLGNADCLVINAANALAGLRRMAKSKSEFTITEIAKIAGVEYPAAHAWMRDGIVPASIRPPQGAGRGRQPIFSVGDALTAGIVGTCRRRGVSLEHLKLVSPLFQERNRAAASTAARS